MYPRHGIHRDDDVQSEEFEGGDIDIEIGREFDNLANIPDENEDNPERRKRRLELLRKEDEIYEGEWGYSLVKALRGKTVGRRLRRKLFKYGCFQLLCGFALFIMAIEENKNFKGTEYFDTAKYGSSLLNLTWLVSFPSVLFGFGTMAMVKHWPSLVTNRKLLTNIMRVYQFICLLLFIFTLWCSCALFLTFQKVKDWSADVTIASMLPYYICSIIFLMPYLAILFFYSLDVSYLTDEVEKGGNIVEFDPPEDTRDLSDVTLFQSCVFVCGFPCIVMIQFLDLFKAVRKTYSRVYGGKSLLSCECLHKKTQVANSNVAKEEAKKKTKGSTLWKRLWKTCIRCFRGSRANKKALVQPVVEKPALPLKELERDREKEERDEREKMLRAQEEERQRLAAKEAEENSEFLKKQQQALEEAAKRLEVQKRKEMQEDEAKKLAEEFANRWESVLTVAQFKPLWSSLSTQGSFQCALKSMPTVNLLTDHLKKQGFHVVFAVSSNVNNIEIGICNVRPVSQPGWFLARFLVADNNFSAVMKSDTPEMVPNLVKRFALAKILKIDTPAK